MVFFEQQLIDSVVTDPIYMWQMDVGFIDVDSPKGRSGMRQTYMSMSQFIIRYVRELGVISIQDACKKLGSVPAQHFMLEDRGTLEVGKYADINVFDINELKINSTFTDPMKYSTGMYYVFVNGKAVVKEGKLTGLRAGKVLRHLPKK